MSDAAVRLRDCAVRVASGSGVVARDGRFIAFLDASPSDPAAHRLLAVLTHEGSGSGRALLRAVAAQLVHDDARWPPFALISDDDEGLAVMVHGGADLLVGDATGGTQTLSSAGALTWVDRILTDPFVSLAAGSSTGSAQPPLDLKHGVVPGGGMVVEARTSVSAAAEPEQVPEQATTQLAEVDDVSDGVDVDAPLVDGVHCARNHFNPPTAAYCSSCGTSMVHQTFKIVQGRRPPLGVLVLEDGRVATVDRNIVIGREPEAHPDVAAGRARPVALDDPRLTVSRCHAELVVEGWDVHVVDRGSSNGTLVVPPGDTEPTRLAPDSPAKLQPGTRLVLGEYTLTFSSGLG